METYFFCTVSYYTPGPWRGRGVYCFTSVLTSVQDIFRHIFLSNYQWQKSDIWSQASYRYAILWVAFLDPSDSYFLFADLVGFYTHWTYMHIFCRIFLSNYWWHKSDIWSQASYWYPISWEAFLDPSDSYFLFADFVDFYTHWTYFQLFSFKKKFLKFQYKSDQVKNWHFKSWCICFRLFFIGFHLFYLLIIISINLFTTFFHNIIVTSTLKMQFSYCMNLLICFS